MFRNFLIGLRYRLLFGPGPAESPNTHHTTCCPCIRRPRTPEHRIVTKFTSFPHPETKLIRALRLSQRENASAGEGLLQWGTAALPTNEVTRLSAATKPQKAASRAEVAFFCHLRS